MEKKKNIRFALMIAAAVFIALLGIVVGSVTIRRSNEQTMDEHRSHLEDIARSVDQNSANLFHRIRQELAYSIRNCLDDLPGSPIGLDELITDLVVRQQDGNFVSCQGIVRDIRQLESSGDDICLCVDGDSRSYLVFLCDGADGLTYGALLDLSAFYQRVVVHSIAYHYWVVLYDRDSNLMLQNHETQPDYLLLNREQIAARDDGYSLLQRRELEEGSGSGQYSYVNTDTGKTETCQMSVLTTSDSQNGIFAIGVAAYAQNITHGIRTAITYLILAAALITVSIALLLFGILTHRRQANAIREKLALTEQLLDKQAELARSQRLEALGVMTSSIAHEFNNLLTPITGYSLLCMEKLPEDSGELYDNLLAIYQAADKARITVRRLSALTRKTSGEACTCVSPDEIVKKALDIGLPSKPKNVSVQTSLNCADDRIRVDETQVLQVLLNLLLNAFQAMEGLGGEVCVSTCREADDIVFTVADTGPGIPSEIMDRIFEPFFTTKDVGKGSGLGLAIARQVAEAHAGTITARSTPGKGAEFTLRLPRNRGNDAASAKETGKEVES